MSREEWGKIIEAFGKSGKSQSQWCRDNDLKYKSFNLWHRKLNGISEPTNKKSEKLINWIPVKLETPPTSKLNIRIGKAEIEIENGYDEKLLLSVIKSLESIC